MSKRTVPFGGAERNRTAGLVIANDALYQLSYGPTSAEKYAPVAECVKRSVPGRSSVLASAFCGGDGLGMGLCIVHVVSGAH